MQTQEQQDHLASTPLSTKPLSPTPLSQLQVEQFHQNGFLMVENAVTATQLQNLQKVFAEWVEDSRLHTQDYGTTLGGRARFDVQPGHSASKPSLRRIQSPEEISDVYANVMRKALTVDMCTQLIGPNIRFHHGKINSKQPGTATKIKWHQDFPFEPMSNDDMITCLLFLDAVTLENGPLEIIPSSHKGPLYSHWHQGKFVGAVADELITPWQDKIVKCTGVAGSVCLMHARLLHASAANLSTQPRTLYITNYYAEYAIELSPNHLPSQFTHELVRGRVSGQIRCTAYTMALPEVPKGTSFFAQQAMTDN